MKEKPKMPNQSQGFGLDEESKRQEQPKSSMNILYMCYSAGIIYSDYHLWLNSGYNNQLREMWQMDAEQNFKMQYLWEIF